MTNFLDPRLPRRFWNKVIPEPNTGCWLWIAGVFNDQEYGCFWLAPRMRHAHHVSYEALVGPIPDGLVTDHLCRTTCCVNPDHLEPVTQAINCLRGVSPLAEYARQTHCKNGHELTPENTLTWHKKRGHRACRTCRNERIRKKKAAIRVARRQP